MDLGSFLNKVGDLTGAVTDPIGAATDAVTEKVKGALS
jgi:hypothetical protein